MNIVSETFGLKKENFDWPQPIKNKRALTTLNLLALLSMTSALTYPTVHVK